MSMVQVHGLPYSVSSNGAITSHGVGDGSHMSLLQMPAVPSKLVHRFDGLHLEWAGAFVGIARRHCKQSALLLSHGLYTVNHMAATGCTRN